MDTQNAPQAHDGVPPTKNATNMPPMPPQQQPPMPPQQQQPQPPMPPRQQTNGLAVAGLVLGILAIVGSWVPVLNAISALLGIVGLILAIVGLAKHRKYGSGKGMAIAGIVLSALAIVVSIAMTGAFVAYYASDDSDSNANATVTATSDDAPADSEGANANASSDGTSDGKSQQSDESSDFRGKFAQIAMDMSLDDVRGVMGSDGELSMSSDHGSYGTSEHYRWEGPRTDSISVDFSDGKVSMKHYNTSGTSDGTATLDKFNSVQNGMSYDDVKGVMGGDGILTDEYALQNSDYKTYEWSGSEAFSAASITFENGAVSSMSQYGLK